MCRLKSLKTRKIANHTLLLIYQTVFFLLFEIENVIQTLVANPSSLVVINFLKKYQNYIKKFTL